MFANKIIEIANKASVFATKVIEIANRAFVFANNATEIANKAPVFANKAIEIANRAFVFANEATVFAIKTALSPSQASCHNHSSNWLGRLAPEWQNRPISIAVCVNLTYLSSISNTVYLILGTGYAVIPAAMRVQRGAGLASYRWTRFVWTLAG